MLRFRHFVKRIFQLTFLLIVVLSILSLDYFGFFQTYKYFTWASLFFFVGLTLFSGYYNSRSIKKPFFLNIFMGTLAVKFVFSVLFFAVFWFVLEPGNKFFVIPYFALFTIYKVFETMMLLKYSREESAGSGIKGDLSQTS